MWHKRQVTTALLALPLAALIAAPAPVAATQATAVTCAGITKPEVPGTQVLSVKTVEKPDGGVVDWPTYPGYPPLPPVTDVPALCDVSITLTHPTVEDRVLVRVWLPVKTWNGRFQGSGGGGYSAADQDANLALAVKQGYAVATTDAGVDTNGLDPGKWALRDDGRVNIDLLTNFASRSLHDMAVAGKAVTAQFYGRPANYAYWNGCSTGGRQGLMEAQRYPDDYDGINAQAPAINLDRFVVADLWPQVVMNQERNFPTPCEFEAFRQATITACDRNDGVADRIINEPKSCRFNPYALVGKKITCDGKEITITRADAEVVRKIWDGPSRWYGLDKGVPFSGLAHTETTPDGKTKGVPFPIASTFVQYFLKEDPAFDITTITYREFERLFTESHAKYNRIIGTDNPNLAKFRASGGKMITWHGIEDSIIPYQGTVDYRDRVERAMGGAAKVDEFYRVFLAPGVDHCAGGLGPNPTDPLAAVVAWVERGQAPDTLPARSATATRNLCRYPQVSRYDGHGDPNAATSYTCVRK